MPPNLRGCLVSATVLCRKMRCGEHNVQVLFHGHRLPFVRYYRPIVYARKAEHFLGPEAELSGLDGGALWVLEYSHDIVVAGQRNQRLVALFRGEGHNVVVQKIIKVGL